MVWKPHVTVAAIIERDQRFLLVEEQTVNGIAFNQPAGHLEPGESLINAVKREVKEETAWQFTPEFITAIHGVKRLIFQVFCESALWAHAIIISRNKLWMMAL